MKKLFEIIITKIFKNNLFIGFIPLVLSEVVLFVFQYISDRYYSDSFGNVFIPSFHLIFSIIIFPIYLLVANFKYNLKNKMYNFFPNIISMWIVSLTEVGLSYLGWGLNTGLTFNPDVETVMIIKLMAILNLISILVLGIILHFILQIKKKTFKS